MILKTERTLLIPWEEKYAERLYELAKDDRVGPVAGRDQIYILFNLDAGFDARCNKCIYFISA